MSIVDGIAKSGVGAGRYKIIVEIANGNAYVNGVQVTDSEAPDTVKDGDVVRVGTREATYREVVLITSADSDRLFDGPDLGSAIAYLEEVKKEADEKGMTVKLDSDYGHLQFFYYRKNPAAIR